MTGMLRFLHSVTTMTAGLFRCLSVCLALMLMTPLSVTGQEAKPAEEANPITEAPAGDTETPAGGTEAKLTYGQQQLAALLADRPSMRDILPEDDVIARWVIRRFEDGPSGTKVRWDDQEPLSGRDAENHKVRGNPIPCVRITESKDVSGRDKWYMLVFELGNVPDPEVLKEMTYLVRDNAIDRKQFALACVEHEFEALLRTAKFFRRYPIPGATRQNAPKYTRAVAIKVDFQGYVDFLDSLNEDSYDPREYFGRWYDKLERYHAARASRD